MEQGRFEELIKAKFNSKEINPSDQVWTGIDHELNKGLLTQYSKRTRFYQLVSAAAILLAFSIVFVWATVNDNHATELEASAGKSFNPLKSGNFYNTSYSGLSQKKQFGVPKSPKIVFIDLPNKEPIINVQTHQTQQAYIASYGDQATLHVESIEPQLILANAEFEVSPYRKATYSNVILNANKTKDRIELWAGISAEAGSFNPEFAGQNNITNGINAGALPSVVGQSLNSPTATSTQNGFDQGSSRSVGMDFGMKLGRRWALESGIAYASMEAGTSANLNVVDIFAIDEPSSRNVQGTLAQPSLESSIFASEVLDDEINLQSRFQTATIPLKAGYFVYDNLFSVRLNAGLAANYMVSNSLRDESASLININDLNNFNDWYFDGVGGLEFGYSFLERLDFTLEPMYRKSLTPISTNVTGQAGFNVKTGLRYRLR